MNIKFGANRLGRRIVKPYLPVSELIRTLLLVAIALACAVTGYGDTVGSSGNNVWQYSSVEIPNADYSGWFFNSAGPLFPSQPDPSEPWTSAENIAIMNSWLSLVNSASGDPSALANLYGLGMNNSTAASDVSQIGLSGDEQRVSTTEPGLLGLMGAGSAILMFCAAIRRDRVISRGFTDN